MLGNNDILYFLQGTGTYKSQIYWSKMTKYTGGIKMLIFQYTSLDNMLFKYTGRSSFFDGSSTKMYCSRMWQT